VVIAEFILTWKPMGKCKKCLLRNCCTDERTWKQAVHLQRDRRGRDSIW